MSIKSLLKKYDIHPRKSLGQNFLIELPVIEKIVRTLNPSASDKVLEIGPGIGVMTGILAGKAEFVAAIETDPKMIKVLETEIGTTPNLHIIHGDILDANLESLLTGPKWLFVGNIPYNITSPLLFHLRKFRRLFSHGVLTIQKEVATRLTASPKTKDYGILNLAMSAVADIEECFDISASSFFPIPAVQSTLIKIKFFDVPKYNIKDLDFFTTIVRAAFSTRRKKIKNAMMQSRLLDIPDEKIVSALEKAQIPENSRAEELSIETFSRLADILAVMSD